MKQQADGREGVGRFRTLAGPACVASAGLVIVASAALANIIPQFLGGLFYLGYIGWLGACDVALWQRHYRWVFVTAPVIVVPLVFLGFLLVACSRGNCFR